MSDPKNEAGTEDDIEVIIDGEDEAAPEAKAEGGEVEAATDEREAVDADDDGEDADSPDDTAEKREARKRRRQNRAARRAEERKRDKEEIDRLKRQLDELAPLRDKVTEFDEFRTAQQTREAAAAKAHHEDQIRRAQNTYADAVERRKKALTEGDGEAFNQADADIRLAERVYQESTAAIQTIGKEPQRREAREPSNVDMRKKVKAEAFLSEHSWYDPKLGDEDSVILKAIDDQLAREGSDPSTDAHWDELKRRAAKRIPERFAAQDRRPAQDASRTPPEMVGGSSRDRSTGPNQRVTMSAERYNALLDSGKISGKDDPQLKVWAKKYAAYDRNNAA